MSSESKSHSLTVLPKAQNERLPTSEPLATRVQNSQIYSKSYRSHRSTSKTSKGSKSPRYRSPTHNKLLLDSNSRIPCKTCEKRLLENNSQTFHDSPPRVRPSHHNIVCSSCSTGSYSKILKVVCLNSPRESKSETTKVKIIENFSDVEGPSMFPLMGSGRSYQVHYEEVLLPPKTELTSLVPDPSKENWFRFQLKEEERKRVTIRRAEYANRMKGLAKTVVTTFGLGEHSRVPIFCEEEDENQEIESFNQEDLPKGPKELKEKVKNQGEGLKVNKKPLKKVKRDKVQERGRSLDLSSKESTLKYFQKVRDESLKRNLEQSKVSIKHKILAKFAEKNFAHLINVEEKEEINEKLMTSENSVLDDEEEQKVKVENSFNIFDSIEMPEKPQIQEILPQQNKGNDSTLIKSFEDSYNLSDTLDVSVKSPETQDETFCHAKELLLERPKSNQGHSSQLSSPLLRIEEGSEDSSEHLQTLEKEESPEINTQNFKDSLDNGEKGEENVGKIDENVGKNHENVGKNHENVEKNHENIEKREQNEKIEESLKSENSEKSKKPRKSEENIEKTFFELEECSSDEQIVFSSKSIEESLKRESREASLTKEKDKSYEEFEEVKKKLEFVGNPFEDSPQGQDYSDNDQAEENFSAEFLHQISFEDISHINNLTIHDQSSLTIFTAANDKTAEVEEKKDKNSEKQLVTFRDNQAQQEELIEQHPAPAKSEHSSEVHSAQEEEPQVKDLQQGLLQLVCILNDPQVIKGLKLLGGFADYLERFGKDVLDIE